MAIQVPPDSTGKLVRTSTVSGEERQEVVWADPTTLAARAAVKNGTPAANDYGGVVRIPPAAAIITGQATVAVTETALPSNACRRVRVRAFLTNNHEVFIGPAGVGVGSGFPLWPGDEVLVELPNTNLISHIAAGAGASIAFLAEA